MNFPFFTKLTAYDERFTSVGLNSTQPIMLKDIETSLTKEQQAKELWIKHLKDKYYYYDNPTEAAFDSREETLLALEKEIKEYIRCIEGTDSELDRGALMAYELILSKLKTVPPTDKQ